MIVSALVALLCVAPSAPADTDFSLTWSTGEQSRDASSFETSWTLQGTTLARHSKASGRTAHGPGAKETRKATPVPPDEMAKVVARLREIDEVAKKVGAKEESRQGRFTSVRYVHGKVSIELYFPYWVDDTDNPPKDEPKAKREVLEKIDALRGKLVDIEG